MRRAILLLFLLALGVRVAAALVFGVGGPPVEDERGYTLLATSLVETGALELEVPRPAEAAPVPPRTSFRAPGLPLLLAPLAGLGAGAPAMRVFVLLLAALGAPLLYVAARPLLGGRPAAWAAGAYALWPPAVYLALRVLSEAPSQALLLGGVALLVHRRGAPRAGLAGVLVAGAVLVRPAALLAALPLGAFAGGRRQVAAFAVGVLLVLAPWVVRNHAHHGRPLLTTNSGVTLVGGTSSAAAEAEPPGKWLSPVRVYAGSADAPDLGMWGWSQLGEEASDRQFAADAWDWTRANPRGAARLAGWKVVRLFDPDPRSAKSDAPLKRALGYATLPILLLALVGAVDARSRRWLPWLVLVAGTVVTAMIFYGDTRMRTAADPALLVLAAAGATRLVPRRKDAAEAGNE